MGDVVVVIFGVALTVATVVVLLRQGEVPRRLARERSTGRRVGLNEHRPRVTERPAGPDAEDTGVGGPGQPLPNPGVMGDEEVG